MSAPRPVTATASTAAANESRSDPVAGLRLPAVMAGYACAQTSVCCRPPFGAFHSAPDRERIRARLATRSRARLLARFEAALRPVTAGGHVLAQPGGACGFLTSDRDCELHRAVGLSHLGAVCRNFPRSVLATPDGLEVGFVLACPTAARRVAQAPRAFGWRQRGVRDWPYGATRRVGPRVALTFDRAGSWADLTTLRRGWWSALESPDAAGLIATLWGLTEVPLKPSAALAVDWDAAWPGLPSSVASAALAARARIVGDAPAAGLHASLQVPVPLRALATAAPAPIAAMACATGLAVQIACGHVAIPASEALRLVGWELLMALAILRSLRQLGIDPEEATAQALCVAAQVGAERLFQRRSA